MELDDLKHTWKETKSPVHDQQTLNPETLEKMTGQNYRSKMKKIMMPEIVGSIVCLTAAAFIGLRFTKLDTDLLQAAGVLSILLLLLLPIISTLSTWKLGQVGKVNRSYAETLKSFAVQQIRFIKLQKLNVILSYLLLVTTIVILSKLFSGKDISGNKYYWLFSFTIGFIFLLFYSRWVEKYYRRSLRQAEELLQELAA
jgi:hypothetical protein